jgi:hypothetical protein
MSDERRPDGGEHPLDVDAAFADIVAHFHDGEPSRPQVVDDHDVVDVTETVETAAPLDPTDDGPAPPAPQPPPVPSLPPVTESRQERLSRIEAEIERAVHGSDGGHFVPPEPPPIPRPDLPGRLAWAGVLAGPVLLLLCALFWQSVPQWVVGAIVTGIVGGFGYLVWRLPRSRDRDDPDDGAIV